MEIFSVFHWISMWSVLSSIVMHITTWSIQDREYLNFLYSDSLTPEEVLKVLHTFCFNIFHRITFSVWDITIATCSTFPVRRSKPWSPPLKGSSWRWSTRLSASEAVPSSEMWMRLPTCCFNRDGATRRDGSMMATNLPLASRVVRRRMGWSLKDYCCKNEIIWIRWQELWPRWRWEWEGSFLTPSASLSSCSLDTFQKCL